MAISCLLQTCPDNWKFQTTCINSKIVKIGFQIDSLKERQV
jgi:hypothetical protein